jgi:hypothetical protein
MRYRALAAQALAALAVLGAGCSSIAPVRIEPPAVLADQPPHRLEGLGGARQGRLSVAGWQGTYRRGSDRLSLFSDAATFVWADASGELRADDGREMRWQCRGREAGVGGAALQLTVRPWQLRCEVRGSVTADLALDADTAAATEERRSGEWVASGGRWRIESLHRWAGVRLPSASPTGYVIRGEDGLAVAALELNGPNPRAWLPTRDANLNAQAVMVTVMLAAVWDPAR